MMNFVEKPRKRSIQIKTQMWSNADEIESLDQLKILYMVWDIVFRVG